MSVYSILEGNLALVSRQAALLQLWHRGPLRSIPFLRGMALEQA